MAQDKNKIDREKEKNAARKWVNFYRISGGYRFVDRGGVIGIIRVRDDVPEDLNIQFAEGIQALCYQYGKAIHVYRYR